MFREYFFLGLFEVPGYLSVLGELSPGSPAPPSWELLSWWWEVVSQERHPFLPRHII